MQTARNRNSDPSLRALVLCCCFPDRLRVLSHLLLGQGMCTNGLIGRVTDRWRKHSPHRLRGVRRRQAQAMELKEIAPPSRQKSSTLGLSRPGPFAGSATSSRIRGHRRGPSRCRGARGSFDDALPEGCGRGCGSHAPHLVLGLCR